MPTQSSYRNRSAAKKRKQRERERLKASGVVLRQFKLPRDINSKLKLATLFHPTQTAEGVLIDALTSYFAKATATQQKVQHLAKLWPRVKVYRRYSAHLLGITKPVRIGTNIFTPEEATLVAQADDILKVELRRLGIQHYESFLDELVSITS